MNVGEKVKLRINYYTCKKCDTGIIVDMYQSCTYRISVKLDKNGRIFAFRPEELEVVK